MMMREFTAPWMKTLSMDIFQGFIMVLSLLWNDLVTQWLEIAELCPRLRLKHPCLVEALRSGRVLWYRVVSLQRLDDCCS
jgi:hypothetical protein